MRPRMCEQPADGQWSILEQRVWKRTAEVLFTHQQKLDERNRVQPESGLTEIQIIAQLAVTRRAKAAADDGVQVVRGIRRRHPGES